jgi:hypothetical protein
MGEVATVAAIVGGFATSGVTGLVTWKVSRNTTSVELVKVAAENHRLRYGNQEDERRNRQSTYHDYLNAVINTFQLMGFAASPNKIAKLRDEYRYLHAGVVLFGPRSVRVAANEVGQIYSEVWPSLDRERQENPEKSESECWRDASAGHKEPFGYAITRLTDLMHADITRDVVKNPDSESR